MRHGFIAATAVLLFVTACSDDHGSAATTVSSTIAAATTSTTSTTSTTIAPTTTTEALPVPQAPPAPHAAEPTNKLGTIEIPKINVSKSLFEGVSLTTLNRGPGHWPGTAMPGHAGNVVVGGHRTSHDRPFRYLDKLVPGDEVIFTTPEGRFVYHVTGTRIVTPDSVWIINQTAAHTATLFACNPVGSTKERIVVSLELQ
ncbi:MAG: sortase [Actinobacteria bacterium]|uniref:Unannotated protein n=1 Tax=freshwater metagenome TaxID=449393 RepID=A0A6J7ICK3_9ZZZZ|nr:sortase [Actinomycetota bacterium]MSW77302.1 sortase [Actinomycetota bacterium]MSX57047.1 sortase [Actinomycetota bacterium]MSZ82767.1 sortase [Actinomycetota bacterium]MTB17669.1 sortase [Actinomycetota bacterium]